MLDGHCGEQLQARLSADKGGTFKKLTEPSKVASFINFPELLSGACYSKTQK